jgi:vacuolar-type H+-ATPase subunit F/Vma7
MSKLVVVGTKRLALPLTAVGFKPVPAATPAEMESALDALRVDRDVALVVVGESQAQHKRPAIERFRKSGHGVVLVVPDGPESKGLSFAALKSAIEQAAGVDLLGKQG